MLMLSVAAWADIPAGYVSWDVVVPGSFGEFDIINATGPNSSGDATFPISNGGTALTFSSLSLTVHFSDGSTVVEPSSYFTLALDGESFDGSPISIGGVSPKPTSATLTGSVSPTTFTEFDGSSHTVIPNFIATISPSSPPDLSDGDLAEIDLTPATTTVPEPASWILMGTIVACVGISRKLQLREMLRKLPGSLRGVGLPLVALLACSLLIPSAHAVTVKLSGSTAPSSATTGNDVNVTVLSNWPAGDTTPGNVIVSWYTACGGTLVATSTGNSLKTVIGTSERVDTTVPSSLTTAEYFVTVTDTAGGDTPVSSSNCSAIQVTATTKALEACVPSSSLGVVAPATGPAPVYAIVPKSCWDCAANTGIEISQVETGGGPAVANATLPTTGDVNSCAGNPATGEAVCVDNGKGVYHITGVGSTNTVTNLTSGATGFASFSGGSCENCGVAVNSGTNQAIIAEGANQLQVLNLSTNTFATPFPLAHEVSENIVVDFVDGGILSLGEDNFYDFISYDSSGNLKTEYGMPIAAAGEGDSSAVDCKTHIALGPYEFTNELSLTDITQATFTPGTPGTWTAPTAVITILGSYSAGLSGSAVAPGVSDLGVVAGEFGGSSFAILKLPATSGSGTPALVDYAYVPCVTGFSAGLDPHTLTSYVSPNNGKSYALQANWLSGGGGVPTGLLNADMAGILALPRAGDGHTVLGETGPGSCLSPTGAVGSTVLTTKPL